MWSHLDQDQKAVVEGSSQDEVTRCPDQKLITLTLRHSSNSSILIRDLKVQEGGLKV